MKNDKTKELLDEITAQQENAWDDLLIHAWVSQLMLEASGLYVSRQNARSMPMAASPSSRKSPKPRPPR